MKAWLRTLVLTLPVAACTLIVEKPPVVVDPEPPKRAYMLWLLNLDKSAVNMAEEFETLIREFEVALAGQSPAIVIDRLAVMPLNRRTSLGARLIYGEDVPTKPLDLTLQTGLDASLLDGVPVGRIAEVVTIAAGTAFLDQFDPSRAEQQNLADIAATLASESAYDPFSSTAGRPVFDGTPDLFIVGTITHLSRACAADSPECALAGKSPATYFTAEADGKATWLNVGEGLSASRIFHVSFATGERESEETFFSRCGNVTGFPQAHLELLAPSPHAYYEPLSAIAGGRFIREDLCTMLGVTRKARLLLLARGLAQAAP